ncbi:MAG: ABC-F family ATP-binding cassette domain-containing protein [Bdellovibrionales bacterium]
MSVIVSIHQLTKTFASRTLFDKLTFSVSAGERIGLIGPNGAGKSTLMKIIAGKSSTDGGTVSLQRGLKVGYLEQVPKFEPDATVQSAVNEGAEDPYEWEIMALSQELMSRLDLNHLAEAPINKLSGGWQKRVALARELLRQPDLLLLDEPTNHLDVESILWLEDFLAKARFATITITHDRVFLQRVSNRIIELDRRNPGGLLSVNGDYTAYLEQKQFLLNAQTQQETKLRNTLRRETEWLRRGAQARQTKQQARIKAHGTLSDQVDDLAARNVNAISRIDFVGLEKNPKKLIDAQGISKAYNGQTIVPKIDLVITPKSRIGLLGANGAGKSTLIRLLLKREEPDQGTVTHAERLEVAYFEQNRESLDPNKSLVKTICPEGEWVDYAGTKIHIRSYLSRFLFASEQMELPVGKLSGGEQSRLLIARLMLNKSNLLVLDEPTNDLDMQTLDVLEEVLKEFNGAVILVTHDRYFMDQVANQILSFGLDSKGKKAMFSFADLSQWETWNETQPKVSAAAAGSQSAAATAGAASASTARHQPKKKLSYNQQRELDGMEASIQKAEAHLAQLTEQLGSSEAVADKNKMQKLSKELAAAQTEVERLYARWSELTQE